MTLVGMLAQMLENQRPHRMLWLPVFFGLGIGTYFSVSTEPSFVLLTLLIATGVPALVFGFNARFGVLVFCAATILGFAHAGMRSRVVAAPVLDFNFWGAVEGRVIGLDRSAGNAPRLLLDQVYLSGLLPRETPRRVRISLHGYVGSGVLRAGARVTAQARLSPPGSPVEPGGFDFRRLAWFDRIGAIGYVRDPALLVSNPSGSGLGEKVFGLRLRFSELIRARMPDTTGPFAAAILTGDRSALDPAQMTDLRASNLAHLLAISGLHMGLLTGFVFAVVRYGLALIPSVALNLSLKKLAAAAALAAGVAYLLLSGANVATQRAFIMTAVVLVAVLLDRPALTLRAVAIAALIVLLAAPESLTEAGFQMSFAATTALIAAFNTLRGTNWWRALGHGRWRHLRPLIMLVVTSGVAGFATAPFSAFHFNQVSQFGLLANLLAVPAMGLLVMPAAVVAFCLAPLGLDGAAYWAMSLGIGWILDVAHFVANLDGAIWYPVAGPPGILPMITMGSLFVILWQGWLRIAGLVPVMLALIVWSQVERPDVLISDDGRLFGIRTAAGRALNTARGHGFAANNWLENDGDPATQAEAAIRASVTRNRARSVGRLRSGVNIVWLNSAEPEGGDCIKDTVLVAPKWARTPEGNCLFVGKELLEKLGAISVSYEGRVPTMRGALDAAGNRPWGDTRFRFH